MPSEFNHFDEKGNAIMVDVSNKEVTHRVAVAQGDIHISPAVFSAVKEGRAAKGDVLGVARVAGIMAAKRTYELIPMCHPLMLTRCAVDFIMDSTVPLIRARCTVETEGKTGVEMEALTGASAALLTIYDMCKAIDKSMTIGNIHLVHKSGGKSGEWNHPDKKPDVIAISGVKNAGKTTLIEKMLPHLKALGLKTAVIKHDGHRFEPDVPGTDSYRHRAAGAYGNAIFSKDTWMAVKSAAVTEKELIALFPEADLFLLEGFKHTTWPKIEVVRKDHSSEIVCDMDTVIALATDLTGDHAVPSFHPDDVYGLAQFLFSYLKKGECML